MTSNKLSKEDIISLCELGATAPSGGNIQPWHVDVYRDLFVVSLDPVRSQSILDYKSYASMFSLGSFVENVSIGLQHLGVEYAIEIQEKAIHILLNKKGEYTNTKKLYPYIQKRFTSRTMSNGEIIPETDIQQLSDVICNSTKEVAISYIQHEQDKKKAADLLGKSDGVRTFHNQLFQQMMQELRFDQTSVEKTRDGIDVNTLELPGNAVNMMKLLSKHPTIRQTIPKRVFEHMAKPLLQSTSHLACLIIQVPYATATIIEAGRRMQRFWLTATQLGIQLHPWTVQTFFHLRAMDNADTMFHSDEKKEIISINKELCSMFQIQPDYLPFFIFRLYKGNTSTYRSLRLPWNSFTSFHL